MASIVYTNSNALLNPTTNYLPIKGSNKLEDSMLCQQSTNFLTSINVTTKNTNGISINNNIGRYQLGDIEGNFNGQILDITEFDSLRIVAKKYFILQINDSLPEIRINGSVTSGSVGVISGQHLVLKINGTNYKIQLFNP
jgi:hypothetical protein